jgi:hypothetical protein
MDRIAVGSAAPATPSRGRHAAHRQLRLDPLPTETGFLLGTPHRVAQLVEEMDGRIVDVAAAAAGGDLTPDAGDVSRIVPGSPEPPD